MHQLFWLIVILCVLFSWLGPVGLLIPLIPVILVGALCLLGAVYEVMFDDTK